MREGFQTIHQEKKPYSIQVEVDSTITPEVKYIKLEQTEKDGYGIKEILYHNASCFTYYLIFLLNGRQGLIYNSKLKRFYESCGQYQQSLIQMYSLEEKKVYSRVHLPASVFGTFFNEFSYVGEGIVLVDDRLTVLTWKEKTSFIYRIEDKKFSFVERKPFHSSNGEGWGATAGLLPNSDTKVIFLSDGTCNILAVDPITLQEIARKCIIDKSTPSSSGAPVRQINELQYVNGKIIANVWMSNKIAIIDWEQSCVTKWIDLRYLVNLVVLPSQSYARYNAVLNGLAWDEEHNDLFVTGKFWNRMFRIHLF